MGAGIVAGDSVIEIHSQVDALTPAVAVEECDRATGTDQQVVGWIVGSKDELGCLEDSPPFGLVADEDGIEKGSRRSGLVGDNGSGVCGEYGIDSKKEQTGWCVTSKGDRNPDQLVPGRQSHNLVAFGHPFESSEHCIVEVTQGGDAIDREVPQVEPGLAVSSLRRGEGRIHAELVERIAQTV
jgi:hypothetical protein